ncbi:MAG TPA: hypothetical protein VGN12_27915 [Pirellulales bacterium]|jgi:hypothetical protein
MKDRYPNLGATDYNDSPIARQSLAAGPALPTWITPELIAETIRVWQPYYQARLTAEDAIAIVKDVGRLLDVLSRNEVSK